MVIVAVYTEISAKTIFSFFFMTSILKYSLIHRDLSSNAIAFLPKGIFADNPSLQKL